MSDDPRSNMSDSEFGAKVRDLQGQLRRHRERCTGIARTIDSLHEHRCELERAEDALNSELRALIGWW